MGTPAGMETSDLRTGSPGAAGLALIGAGLRLLAIKCSQLPRHGLTHRSREQAMTYSTMVRVDWR
jgi:hypothetical protein